MKTLNINSYVRIKLTPFGIEQLRKKHEEIRKMNPCIGEFIPPEVDTEGYSKMQLWKVMYELGGHAYNGSKNLPFEMNIKIDEKAFEK